MTLDKHFHPKDAEERQYNRQEESGAFKAGNHGNEPYSIVIPPPNVTGSLHIGHALNNTLQDILIRFERMRGRDVLWQPGTDHAGIATQMVVERQLSEKNIFLNRNKPNEKTSGNNIGREEFVKKVWEWKELSGGTILNQLRKIGATCDWDRERFTMDEGLSKSVRRVFVELYNQGLIYKDKRLVNWDPHLHTAISDLEVESRETEGSIWNIIYPIDGEENISIIVATTRPETMLGDSAVAVNPSDQRYKHLIGKNARIPLIDKLVPIIADEHADPESGTGAVKITPAHDFNDFEIGKKHNLEFINIFDANAHINDNAPIKYRGMDRISARKMILEDLDNLDFLDSVSPHKLFIPYGDRSGVVIEPWLTEQWYVKAEVLAQPAIKAVQDGKVKFIPKQWEKTYFSWMKNIQPWCISRQLWWGHRIPAWYGPDGHIFVEENEDAANLSAIKHYGKQVEISQEEDVLDTWFSSALWPFSTLGWPDKTDELDRFYPTNVLVTSFDIIFFWVARMLMMGIHFMGDIPFKNVYIHPLVRDEKGQKMSKSKGNVIDPLAFIDVYGADSLRFTLASLAAQGREIKLSEKQVEGYRNFSTKLWNAARFCEMNKCFSDEAFDPKNVHSVVNKWIISSTVKLNESVSDSIENFRFNDAASQLYQFIWGTFCDWYLELIKPMLNSENDSLKQESRLTAAWTLSQILHFLHPIMPFITEEIWERIDFSKNTLLINSKWPEQDNSLFNITAEAEIAWVIKLISQIRGVRSEVNVPAASLIKMIIRDSSSETMGRIKSHDAIICRLARLESIQIDKGNSKISVGSAQIILDETLIILPLAEVIDFNVEKERLNKELKKADTEITKLEEKLLNSDFLTRAPEDVVQEQRQKLDTFKDVKERICIAINRLV